jgi:hypothetical protein
MTGPGYGHIRSGAGRLAEAAHQVCVLSAPPCQIPEPLGLLGQVARRGRSRVEALPHEGDHPVPGRRLQPFAAQEIAD